jgi:putative restriction endonuclease
MTVPIATATPYAPSVAFGEIPGQPPGTTYAGYQDMIAAEVHRQRNVGMVGGARNGTESIVLNGGYIDDRDFGTEVFYTGFGGRDGRGHQIADQQWIGANEGMRVSLAHGLPVRVIRGSKGEPALSPSSGYRYDGIYSVEEAWQELGIDGFTICRFRLLRSDSAPLHLSPASSLPPVRRVASTVLRRIRDTAMTARIKSAYGYACQVCGERLTLPGGAAYAEGAHIRPLGMPHDGEDVESNVLCLCPNDHLLLDRGAIYLTDDLDVVDAMTERVRGKIRLAHGHRLDLECVRYHRAAFGH